MFSIKNSFDYGRQFGGYSNILPFTGQYEAVDRYKCIYIYVKTQGHDNVYIDFTNDKNDTRETGEISIPYDILANTDTQYVVPLKLHYYRIRIIPTENPIIQTRQRLYNTYLCDSQMITTDEHGNLNVEVSATISSIAIHADESSISMCDSFANPIYTDSSHSLKTGLYDPSGTALASNGYLNVSGSVTANFSSSAMKIQDSSGNSILTDTCGNLVVSQTSYITNPSSNGQQIISNNAYNMSNDSFGRLRVSTPFTIFDSKHVAKQNGKFTSYSDPSGSSLTYNSLRSCMLLNCSGQNGLVINESKRRFAYQPGKSMLIMVTFCMDGTLTTSNTIQRVGYFDDDNGIFLEKNSTGVYICKRTSSYDPSGNGNIGPVTYDASANGTNYVYTEHVPIALWNGDAFTRTLDFSKVQIFWIDLEWLGVGTVRTGFVIDGQYRLAHVFNHANIIQSVYMTSSQLPIRYENRGDGVNNSSSTTTLTQICSTVMCEGGYEQNNYIRHIGTDTSNNLITTMPTAVNTDMIACAIRIGTDPSGVIQNSSDNTGTVYNSIVIPVQLSAFIDISGTVGGSGGSGGNNAVAYPIISYKIILNPTGGIQLNGTGLWKKYSTTYNDSASVIEYVTASDISGFNLAGSKLNVSGGIMINSGYLDGRTTLNLSNPEDFNSQMGRIINSTLNTTYTDGNGNTINRLNYNSDIIAVVIRLLYLGYNANVNGIAIKIGWYEY